MSPLLVVGLLAGVAVVSVLVTLLFTRKGDAQDPWGAPAPLPSRPEAAKAGNAAPPATRQGDLLALAETTMKIQLAPDELAKGPTEPLPGMTNAYDRIAKGEIHAHLQVIDGPGRGRAAELPHDGKVTVGRGAGNKLDLCDRGASVDQCTFESEGGDVLVRDMASRNGTFVNGDRVKETRRLANCDIVACGASRILVTLDAAPAGMTE